MSSFKKKKTNLSKEDNISFSQQVIRLKLLFLNYTKEQMHIPKWVSVATC